MHVGVTLLAVAYWLVGPMAGATAAEPLPWLLSDFAPHLSETTLSHLRIALHDDPRLAPAFYLPAAQPSVEPLPYRVLRAADPTSSADEERTPPTLVLRKTAYVDETGSLLPLGALPIDSTEYLLYALFLADLDLDARRRAPDWARQAERRAATLFADHPAPLQREAYDDACASFGSHLASIANEVDRIVRRRGDLCRSLSARFGLFATWELRFLGADFAVEGAVGVAATPRNLPLADRLLYLDRVLGGPWTGDAALDFADACPTAEQAVDVPTRHEEGGLATPP